MRNRPGTARSAGYGSLLDTYKPLAGIADELMDPDGRVRPVWEPFLRDLALLSKDALELSLSRGNQYLKDAGVFFRHYGPGADTEREWPLSHVPLLIDEEEWAGIAEGLIERADVLEKVMADVYGPNKLVADGWLPPSLLTANPEWLRPVVGVAPRGGHYLHFIAFDIGRGPDGQWWVLGDRTQAPSGAGFALETRMAISRCFPGMMTRSNVERLAGFFRAFRDTVLGMRSDSNSRAAILSPGPMNDTYFEQAYIARYLGFMLVQGQDMAVRNGELMVRTVAGLRPISVLWRRLDSVWADPLELEETSQLGTPGLLSALRAGSFTMINALGSGVLEMRALMAFMPGIAEHLNGRPLKLPNIATWWCGDGKARDYVKANAERMTIDDALSTRLPFDHGDQVVIGGKTADGGALAPEWIDAQADRLAAQEIVSLSTAPALVDGRLEPRPMSLRVFLARTADGWTVMPGGFARIGHSGSSTDISMQRGGSVCDVWVVAKQPVTNETLLDHPGKPFHRSTLGVLPSRAADNLFWLGRYVERAEEKMRLLRAYHLRLAETDLADLPLSAFLASYLEGLGLAPKEALPMGLVNDISSALASAGQIRDRFSTDGWNALADLQQTVQAMAPRLQPGDDAARAMGVLLRKISGFTGLVHENMYRFIGWRFLTIGRAVERAWATSGLLTALTAPDAPEGALDLAIEAGDSIMTHRRRYAVSTSRNTVIDLLLLDDMNPRSVLYQLQAIKEHLAFLPVAGSQETMPPLMRSVMTLETALAVATPEEITPDRLSEIAAGTSSFSGLLARSYLG